MLWFFTFTGLVVISMMFLCLSIIRKDYSYIFYAIGFMWLTMRLCMLWQGWDVKSSFTVAFFPNIAFFIGALLGTNWNRIFHKTTKSERQYKMIFWIVFILVSLFTGKQLATTIDQIPLNKLAFVFTIIGFIVLCCICHYWYGFLVTESLMLSVIVPFIICFIILNYF